MVSVLMKPYQMNRPRLLISLFSSQFIRTKSFLNGREINGIGLMQ